MSKNQNTGNTGENIAAAFLINKGYRICERNYRKKWGEVDIVARKENQLHFVEVKTISRENMRDVSRITSNIYRPEDNMHEKKIQRLHRAIQSYLGEHATENSWQLDLVAVELFIKDKKATCKLIENVL